MGLVQMKTKLTIGCLGAIIILVFVSLTNVVGYQSVQSSNQKVIKDEVDQKELLFQTIVDIANSKEIQRIILKSQISSGKFFNSDVKFSVFNTPVLTKNQLKSMYLVGLLLSKFISKSRMHSIIEKYRVNNPALQKEINAVIEKDTTLNGEITQLSSSPCDCENENTTRLWNFPVLCTLLLPLFILSFGALIRNHNGYYFEIMLIIGFALNCYWYRAIIHG